MTLRDVITERRLNPDVRRENGNDEGDSWEMFFANGELDEPIMSSHKGHQVDWWRAGNVVLVDNPYQSFLRAI